MISASCSNVHLRLVKKLPGQPPSGAMVPWPAPGASPNVMKQPPPAAAASRQRPARSTGGGVGGGGAGGGAAATGGGSGFGALAQAASAASMSKAATALAPRRLQDLTRTKSLIVTASS